MNTGVGKIKVVVCGGAGRMGTQTMETVLAQSDMELVGTTDMVRIGEKVKNSDLVIESDLKKILEEQKPRVMVDFTLGRAAGENVLTALSHGCACVVGTTGIPADMVEKIREKAEETGVPVLIAPNFSLGAVLMMKFSQESARYFEWAEIMELHHEKKADAPSGTAMRTAEMMSQTRSEFKAVEVKDEKISGVRGGVHNGIHIHSVRLPGLLAHQQVILGGLGETLTIRHDSISRESFMPGVMLAVRKVSSLKGLTIGLEQIL